MKGTDKFNVGKSFKVVSNNTFQLLLHAKYNTQNIEQRKLELTQSPPSSFPGLKSSAINRDIREQQGRGRLAQV